MKFSAVNNSLGVKYSCIIFTGGAELNCEFFSINPILVFYDTQLNRDLFFLAKSYVSQKIVALFFKCPVICGTIKHIHIPNKANHPAVQFFLLYLRTAITPIFGNWTSFGDIEKLESFFKKIFSIFIVTIVNFPLFRQKTLEPFWCLFHGNIDNQEQF